MARRKRAPARPRKGARARVRKEASVPPEDSEDAAFLQLPDIIRPMLPVLVFKHIGRNSW